MIEAAKQKQVLLYINEYVFEETEEVLTRQKRLDDLKKAKAFEKLRIWHRVTLTKEEMLMALLISPDIDDAPIVGAASKAKVDALVSFDRRHLHTKTIEDYIGAPVLTAGEALARVRAQAK